MALRPLQNALINRHLRAGDAVPGRSIPQRVVARAE